MALQSYFPNTEAGRIVWLGNYRVKIATHGAAVGLTAAEISDIQVATAYASNTGHPTPISPPTRKPALPTRWSGSLAKYGHDGVWVESSRGVGDWEFLAIDTVKPYLDERPLLTPGTREYRLRWWDKGEANGDWSPVQSVMVGA